MKNPLKLNIGTKRNQLDTTLSPSSLDYESGNRNVRSRPLTSTEEAEEEQQQQQQQPIHYLSHNLQVPFYYPIHVPPFSASLPPPPTQTTANVRSSSYSSSSSSRRRSLRGGNSRGESSEGNKDPPPYPWAAEKEASVLEIYQLLENKILTITGQVQCQKCQRKYEMEFILKEKFVEVCMFVKQENRKMNNRAHHAWSCPVLPTCTHCEEKNSVKPIIEDKTNYHKINWLFLWLGQLLGVCTIEQLKYFREQNEGHRTGSKNHLLYQVYHSIGEQLAPGKFSTL